MTTDADILAVLHRHLQSVFDSDLDTYHATTAPDLTLYEWYITPHRIDGLPFHDFMMSEAGREDSTASALQPEGSAHAEKPRLRYDLANLKIQHYPGVAICSYTMLLSQGTRSGVSVASYNESRVLVEIDGAWQVVHVHKSPAYKSALTPP